MNLRSIGATKVSAPCSNCSPPGRSTKASIILIPSSLPTFLRAWAQAHSVPTTKPTVSPKCPSISSALLFRQLFFPQLTEEVGTGQEAKFRQTFRIALSTIIWIAMPVAIIAFFARGYVVSFIKNGGDPLISSVLATLIISIFAHSVFHIAARGFYARQDTKTPFIVSIIAIGLTILLAVLFTILGCGPEGLGWAQSIGALAEVCILLSLLQKRSDQKLLDQGFWRNFTKIIFATIITGCVTYSMTKFFPLMASDDSFFNIFPKFCLITLASLIAYITAGYFLGLEQIKPITALIKKILFRNIE